jgi:hypothetical protein
VFSGFLIPVELSILEAQLTSEGIRIVWRTETEHDCFGFHLFRQTQSNDRRQRVTSQLVAGSGTSSVPHDYAFLDPVTAPGTYRYWLVEVAEDGNKTEYGPVEAVILPTSLALDGPYPNPVRDDAELRLIVPEHLSGTAELQLFDLAGRRIGETVTLRNESQVVIRWNTASNEVAPGLYWWRLQAGDESVTKAMIIVR